MFKKILAIIIICVFVYYYRDIISQKIAAWNKKNKLEKEVEASSYYLINVLDAKEFEDAHITGSINVPFNKVNSFLHGIENKEIPLIFYCSNYFCTASDSAAKMAIKKGFKTVFCIQRRHG